MRIKLRSNYRALVTDGLEHAGLTAEQEFFVLGVDSEFYRVINRSGEPILYPKKLFRVLDDLVPAGWHFREYEDGEYFLEPASTQRAGFYEDWHGSDGDLAAQATARRTLMDELMRMAHVATFEDKTLIDEALSRLPPTTPGS